jgi:hypothetical protein
MARSMPLILLPFTVNGQRFFRVFRVFRGFFVLTVSVKHFTDKKGKW